MIQIEIQPLLMKAAAALAFDVYWVPILEFFSPVARQRKGMGANFLKRTTRAYGWSCLPNFVETTVTSG